MEYSQDFKSKSGDNKNKQRNKYMKTRRERKRGNAIIII